ncbi:MAG: hypothetical protein FJ109_07205 [Deltaproteobacteria bacterium]|nr:hypothetical protein [Deltaproteobacteria bacterium]
MGRFLERLTAGEPASLRALGDSLTVGYLVRRGYLDFLEDMLRERFPGCPVRLENHGVCGDTVFDGLERCRSVLRPPPADAVIFQFGTNDCFCGISAERYKAGLLDLVRRHEGSGGTGDLLLLPPPRIDLAEFDTGLDAFRGAVDEVAEETGAAVAPVLEVWDAHGGSEPLWLDDRVHPTEAGYRLMALAVLRVLCP